MIEPIKTFTHYSSKHVAHGFWNNYLDQFRTKGYGYDLWWKTIESDLKQEYNCNLILSSGKTPQSLEFQNNDDYVKFMLRWS